MSPENLSRRAILAGAAAVPALVLPAAVAAVPASAVPVVKATKKCDAKVVRARVRISQADKELDELFKQYPDADCEETPGFNEVERRRDKAIADLVKAPALSPEGLIATAEALTDRRIFEDYASHQSVAASLADDILRYFGVRVAA
jgi:hypothetical protein